MAHTFSTYQEAIFNHVANSNNNLAINAVAGSGKTTTIVEAAKRIPSDKKVLFVAFNSTIADELKERMYKYPNVKCSTLHAHGLSALRHLRAKFQKYDYGFQDRCVMNSEVIDIDTKNQYLIPFRINCSKLYELGRINLIKDNIQDLYDLSDMHQIECIGDEVRVVFNELKHAYDYNGSFIDYTDMIVLPLSDKKRIPKYDVVFIDECQDLSKAQRELMLASIKPNGKFIAVGDRKQAINGFAGASCQSFDFIANLPNTDELPLSVNYRCGKKIIDLAQNIVPQITAFDSAIDGEVIDTDNLKSVQYGDMILCRKTAPLIDLCLKFIKNNIRAYVKGKDIGEGLVNLIKKMKAKNLHSLFSKLDAEVEKAEKSTKGRNAEAKLIALKDKVECINIIAETASDINELISKIECLFNDKETKCISLSTIHKSKGLEADNVFIVIPNKLPLVWKNQLDWQYEQEMNLKYVAITRAKKKLYFVNLDEDQLKKVEVI